MQCPPESVGKLRYNILLRCTSKNSVQEAKKIAALTTSSAFFFFFFCSYTTHLLGINTKSTEFQPNSTGFKLVCGADIRFEQIKTA